MSEKWEIESDEHRGAIRRAADTAIGMSLVSPVSISIGGSNSGWRVRIVATKSGDMGWISCASESQARDRAKAVDARVRRDLASMPLGLSRHPIELHLPPTVGA